tara:strand:+ start:421 stop:684 length:264 start_codon:yes stop_codon:yes gene_type:complete
MPFFTDNKMTKLSSKPSKNNPYEQAKQAFMHNQRAHNNTTKSVTESKKRNELVGHSTGGRTARKQDKAQDLFKHENVNETTVQNYKV